MGPKTRTYDRDSETCVCFYNLNVAVIECYPVTSEPEFTTQTYNCDSETCVCFYNLNVAVIECYPVTSEPEFTYGTEDTNLQFSHRPFLLVLSPNKHYTCG